MSDGQTLGERLERLELDKRERRSSVVLKFPALAHPDLLWLQATLEVRGLKFWLHYPHPADADADANADADAPAALWAGREIAQHSVQLEDLEGRLVDVELEMERQEGLRLLDRVRELEKRLGQADDVRDGLTRRMAGLEASQAMQLRELRARVDALEESRERALERAE